MLIAQLSDLHVRPEGRVAYGQVDTNTMLQRAVDAVEALPHCPDCVVITGDLTDCGLTEEYELLEEILAGLPMPVYLTPGNHDRRDVLLGVLGDRHRYLPRAGFLQYVVEEFPVRLVVLDTVVAGATTGALCATRLAWTEARLAERPDTPTILCMHHPPFPTGVPALDEIGCALGATELKTLVTRHPEVERVLAGHYHRPISMRWAGAVGQAAPSTAHQVVLDDRPGAPVRFVLEPPGFTLHAWTPETGVVSHTLPIGDYGAAFDVALDPQYPGAVSVQ